MPNENCLKGMKCPECGYEDLFGIACDIVMLVDDDGIKDDIGDYDWDDDAYCECRECSHSGTVKDFKTPSPPSPPSPPTTLKTLVDRLKALKEEHEQLESNRDCDDFDMSGHNIDLRENEIYEECFEIAQDIVEMNLGA